MWTQNSMHIWINCQKTHKSRIEIAEKEKSTVKRINISPNNSNEYDHAKEWESECVYESSGWSNVTTRK